MKSAIIEKRNAQMSAHALREVIKRLRAKGQDKHAAYIETVADALSDAEHIHVSDGAGQA